MATKLHFDPFDPRAPQDSQISNIAFINLVTALNMTDIRPDSPSDWKRMVRLLDGFEKLKVNEMGVINGETKPVFRLVQQGGDIVFETAEFELLTKIWDSYAKSLSLAFAKGVVAVQGVLDKAEEIVLQ